MAIQFACAACQQPIEVDDAWANQTVSCPYCRRVVLAPAQSTLQLDMVPPASKPGMAGTAPGSGDFTAMPPPPPRDYPLGAGQRTSATVGAATVGPPAGNALGNWSVVLGVLAWVGLIAAAAVLMPTLKEIMDSVATSMPTGTSIPQHELNQRLQERLQERVLKDPTAMKTVMLALVAMVGAELLGLIGLILGLLGASRSNVRKGTAIAGVVICAAFLAGQCGILTLGALSG